ncbi:MAG: AAA family ATPase [Candidatus Zixiibacteriota bacterium]
MTSHNSCRIVVTGAPGSGKTEFIERLKNEDLLAGFVFFEELARVILSESPDIRHDRSALHREIFRRQTEREDAIGDKSFITDRGTVDAFAFHPETMTEVETSLEREYRRYTAIIQLGSAAALGEPYYSKDDVRRESIAEALAIEAAIRDVWGAHSQFTFIPACRELEDKYVRFRRQIVQYTTVSRFYMDK